MSVPPDVLPLVREFPANGFKYLFRHGDNVADLLRWRTPEIASHIDFGQMAAQPDTFITSDFSALESDVLLRAPFRVGRRKRDWITVFVLIENQSEPDEMIVVRALEYVVMVYRRQRQEWLQTHSNLRNFRFDPVLPVVVYSGTRTWETLPSFASLVHQGTLFGSHIPTIEPLFVDIASTSVASLQREVGMLGWVLWLAQQSKRKRVEFRDVLRQSVGQVDTLPEEKRGRREQLLWYAQALVYHAREGEERDQCVEIIRQAVREAHRAEVSEMAKSIAQTLVEQGREEGEALGKRDTLLRQLRARFKTIPQAIETRIQSSQDTDQLNAWLEAFAVATKLSDIPFDV